MCLRSGVGEASVVSISAWVTAIHAFLDARAQGVSTM